MRALSCFLAAFAVVAACEKKPEAPAGAASAAPPPAESTAEPPAPPRPAARALPPDIDLAELTKQLGCPREHKEACKVLKEFEAAERFTGKTPSGESRWFGKAYIVEGGEERSDYVFLVARIVGTAQVGPSDLPLMVSFEVLPEEQRREAPRLWSNLSSPPRHRANKSNLTLKYLEAYKPREERGAINTTGTSVRLITEVSEDLAYLRQPGLKKLLFLRPSRKMDAKPGDGLYAELWQAVW